MSQLQSENPNRVRKAAASQKTKNSEPRCPPKEGGLAEPKIGNISRPSAEEARVLETANNIEAIALREGYNSRQRILQISGITVFLHGRPTSCCAA
jgi:hypothetical protein